MKTLLPAATLALIALAATAHADPARDPSQSPCFEVNIQNDRDNRASVDQDCRMSYSRTVQAGQTNSAHTVQTGEINNNRVRQYQYEPPRSHDRVQPD